MSSSAVAAVRTFSSGEVLSGPAAKPFLRRGPASLVSLRPRAPAASAGAVRAEAEGKAKGKRRAASGIMKPKPISPELREFVGGAEELPRTEALKLIWAHIKDNNLQDPENRKIIVCDEKLKKIFGGRGRVGFLEISGLLNTHFQK